MPTRAPFNPLGGGVMVDLGPLARIDGDGRSIVEVDEALTDDDLDWLNRHALGARFERAYPTVDVTPDPRLSRQVWQ